jgi:cholesterol transport system auxiliary component
MKLMLRVAAPLALSLAIGGCSVSGLLGGGGKAPTTLQTLTPEAPDPGPAARAVSAGQAVTIGTPAIPKELRTTRVPVQITPTDIQYVTGLQWVDTPDRLFQNLVAETVRRTTNRVVLDTRQSALDPGMLVSGELQRFGYDASSGQVVVVYDAILSSGGRIESRRFAATAPADGSGQAVGPALNRAANQIAQEVAQWIGAVS